MKKKIITIILIAIMLTGCGVDITDDGNIRVTFVSQDFSDTSEIVQNDIVSDDWEVNKLPEEDINDIEEYDTDVDTDADIDLEFLEDYEKRKEASDSFGKDREKLKDVDILESAWQFYINGSVVNLPCTISDLEDVGFTLLPNEQDGLIQERLPSHSNYLAVLHIEDESGAILECRGIITNDTDHECSIYNRTISQLDITLFAEDIENKDIFDFYIADGVSFDNKFYDPYDYYVTFPYYYDFMIYQDNQFGYNLHFDNGTSIYYMDFTGDTLLDEILWSYSDESDIIINDDEFDSGSRKYDINNLPDYMEFTGLHEGLMFDNEFTLNGVKITLPCSVNDLLEAGYVSKKDMSFDKELFANENIDVEFIEEDAISNSINVTFSNFGEEAISMDSDCIHLIRINCTNRYSDGSTVMVKLGNGMTPYVNMGAFTDHFGYDSFIESESYEDLSVYRIADPPASGTNTSTYDIVEYKFDGATEDSELTSILIGADLVSGFSYKRR